MFPSSRLEAFQRDTTTMLFQHLSFFFNRCSTIWLSWSPFRFRWRLIDWRLLFCLRCVLRLVLRVESCSDYVLFCFAFCCSLTNHGDRSRYFAFDRVISNVLMLVDSKFAFCSLFCILLNRSSFMHARFDMRLYILAPCFYILLKHSMLSM